MTRHRILCTSLLLAAFVFASHAANAQVNSAVAADSLTNKVAELKADSIPWKYKGILGAGFNAVQLSNWMGGGQNAVTIRGIFLGNLNYAEQRFSWENNLDLGYSLTKQGSQEFRKADDRFIFGSKASLRQNDWLRYTAFLDLRTQFYVGYNYDSVDNTSPSGYLKISNLMAPGYLTASIGAEFTPIKEFKLLLAPVASRTIFVIDDDLAAQGAFGVNPGQNVRNDVGFLVNANLDWEIMTNVIWRNRLNVFGGYANVTKLVVTDENAFLLKVNDIISVGILTDIFYDEKVAVNRDNGTIGPATQLRNQLVIDFRYQFSNFE